MLYVEGGNNAKEGIDTRKWYYVWDSDDFILEQYEGKDIISAYESGIKFANLSKDTMLYVSGHNCVSARHYTSKVNETDEFYLCYYKDYLFPNCVCVLYWCNGNLYRDYEYIGKDGITIVPAKTNGDKKGYFLFNLYKGCALHPTYICSISKSKLKKLILLEGRDYVFRMGD